MSNEPTKLDYFFPTGDLEEELEACRDLYTPEERKTLTEGKNWEELAAHAKTLNWGGEQANGPSEAEIIAKKQQIRDKIETLTALLQEELSDEERQETLERISECKLRLAR